MLRDEIEEAITKIGQSVARRRSSVELSTHRLEQINRILRWAAAHWDDLEPQVHRWNFPDAR